MRKVIAILFIFVLALALDVGCYAMNTVDNKAANNITTESVKHFEIKVSLQPADQYKGIVIGKINFINIEITNLTDTEFNIGDHFRVLMTQKGSEWGQFAMAASGPTQMTARNIRYLEYGYGSNSITQKGEDEPSIVTHIGNTNNVIHDSSPESQKMDLDKWWPVTLPPKSTVAITWPTFWFSDSADTPKAIATPTLTSGEAAYYCWVNFENNSTREIAANTKRLTNIISNTTEPIGLRAASAAWLIEVDFKNAEHLLAYLQDTATPNALAYRSMQALVIWGSPEIIDAIFNLWEKRTLLPVLDKDMKYYFTWSEHDNAKKYLESIKANKR